MGKEFIWLTWPDHSLSLRGIGAGIQGGAVKSHEEKLLIGIPLLPPTPNPRQPFACNSAQAVHRGGLWVSPPREEHIGCKSLWRGGSIYTGKPSFTLVLSDHSHSCETPLTMLCCKQAQWTHWFPRSESWFVSGTLGGRARYFATLVLLGLYHLKSGSHQLCQILGCFLLFSFHEHGFCCFSFFFSFSCIYFGFRFLLQ